ncbi:MAG: ABC transporter substrate-binding protein [Acidobacteriota bacterium]
MGLSYRSFGAALIITVLSSPWAGAANVEYVEAQPLSKAIQAGAKPVAAGTLKLPVITWGADAVPILANGGPTTQAGSPFANEKLNFEIFKEDDFTKQLQGYVEGRTPFLRGTLGMVNQAAELLGRSPGLEPVVIYQLSWSSGGDQMVVRPGVERPKDLQGKTIVLQRYGPHVDYLDRILKDAGLSFSDVTVKWVRELTIPATKSAAAVDPASAMRADAGVGAVMVITPDALALTSGGTVGTGAEDSVKGAKVLLTTKTADRVIADVYAVRRDWFDAHRAEVQAFAHALFLSEERLSGLMAEKAKRKAEYDKAMQACASILLGSPQATADVEGLLGDGTLVGYAGNVAFFGDTEVRNFSRMTRDIQDALVKLNLLSKPVALAQAKWEYGDLAAGLKDTGGVAAPRFATSKVEQKLAERAKSNDQQGVLFEFEIRFQPNQSDFPTAQYAKDFERAVEMAATYGGAIVEIVGHSDPLQYLKQQKTGASPDVLKRVEQSNKNLSLSRANGVRDSILRYAREKGYTLDPSQFAVAGYGFSKAVFPNPQTEDQWRANMRVTFRVISVEAELTEFQAQ